MYCSLTHIQCIRKTYNSRSFRQKNSTNLLLWNDVLYHHSNQDTLLQNLMSTLVRLCNCNYLHAIHFYEQEGIQESLSCWNLFFNSLKGMHQGIIENMYGKIFVLRKRMIITNYWALYYKADESACLYVCNCRLDVENGEDSKPFSARHSLYWNFYWKYILDKIGKWSPIWLYCFDSFVGVCDFVKGESFNLSCPNKFRVESRRKRTTEMMQKPWVDGYLEYTLYIISQFNILFEAWYMFKHYLDKNFICTYIIEYYYINYFYNKRLTKSIFSCKILVILISAS